MTSFIDYLIEGSPLEGSLEQLRLRLWMQKKFGVTKDAAEWLVGWMSGDNDWDDIDDDVFNALMDKYADEMPYSVAKDHDPMSPEEWILTKRLLPALKRAGFSV